MGEFAFKVQYGKYLNDSSMKSLNLSINDNNANN